MDIKMKKALIADTRGYIAHLRREMEKPNPWPGIDAIWNQIEDLEAEVKELAEEIRNCD